MQDAFDKKINVRNLVWHNKYDCEVVSDATVNVMVMCQLSVYIKLMEATCLSTKAIRFFVQSTSNM